MNANPNGVSSFGIPIYPGIPPTTGSVFWVSSTATPQTGRDAYGKGASPSDPLLTIATALTKCRAGKGDTIIVAENHVETISTDILVNVTNVRIIGIGGYNARPQIRMTAVGASMRVSAANALISNIGFDMVAGGVASVVSGITVVAANCTLDRVYIQMTDGVNQGLTGITLGAGANGCRIVNPDILAYSSPGAIQGILINAVINDLRITSEEGSIRGNFSAAPIKGTSNVTDLLVFGPTLQQFNGAAKVVINLTAGSFGVVRDCVFMGTTWATAADAVSVSCTGIKFFRNFGFDDAAGAVVSGVLCPAAGVIS